MRFTPEQLRRRHSVRVYDGRRLSDADADAVRKILDEATESQPGLRFTLFAGDGAPLSGLRASYGMLKNVANYIAVVVDMTTPHAMERAGYFAQMAVMRMTVAGLATCYVGGTFRHDAVGLSIPQGCQMPFIIAAGYPAAKSQTMVSGLMMRIAHRHDRTAAGFYVPTDGMTLAEAEECFPALGAGLEGLVSAPSHLNRQPVRIHMADGALRAFVDNPDSQSLIDLGIGKFNFAAAAGGRWEWGNDALLFWE